MMQRRRSSRKSATSSTETKDLLVVSIVQCSRSQLHGSISEGNDMEAMEEWRLLQEKTVKATEYLSVYFNRTSKANTDDIS